MYGHVISKFSRMGRFTYPWCSAGALRAPELRYNCFFYIPLQKWLVSKIGTLKTGTQVHVLSPLIILRNFRTDKTNGSWIKVFKV